MTIPVCVDQNECDANTDFHAFLHERYGRCITFNSPEMNRTRFLSDSTPTGPKGQKVNIQRNATNTSGVLLGMLPHSIGHFLLFGEPKKAERTKVSFFKIVIFVNFTFLSNLSYCYEIYI